MKTEKFAYKAGDLNCEGVVAWNEIGPKDAPLLLMAPNWAGVTEKSIGIAQELAAHGYVVFLADMYGVEGRPKGNEVPMDFLQPLIKQPSETRARINAALAAMKAASAKIGFGNASRCAAIGYCFGGSNVLDLARSGADVAAVVSMHGNLKTALPAEAGAVKAAVLVIHGADDPIAPKGDRDFLEDEMRKAGAHWTILAMGGVFHSFTDPSANRPPSSQFSAHACRYGYSLAHSFIADAMAGKL
jgi:dienelactone hydrolase